MLSKEVVVHGFDSQHAGLGIVPKEMVFKSTRGKGREAEYGSGNIQLEYVLVFIHIPTGSVLCKPETCKLPLIVRSG